MWYNICLTVIVDVGMFDNITRNERVCDCLNTLGGELHFVSECSKVDDIRAYDFNQNCIHANATTFYRLMYHKKCVFMLAQFVNEGMKLI